MIDAFVWLIQGSVILGWIFLAMFLWNRCDNVGMKMDPTIHCDVYKTKGCNYIDGIDCNPSTCGILSEFKSN